MKVIEIGDDIYYKRNKRHRFIKNSDFFHNHHIHNKKFSNISDGKIYYDKFSDIFIFNNKISSFKPKTKPTHFIHNFKYMDEQIEKIHLYGIVKGCFSKGIETIYGLRIKRFPRGKRR